MKNEELELYVKKACANVFKKLAENPEEMLNLIELQDKHNNLLKEKIELKRQIKKKNEVIDKTVKYIKQHWVIDNPVLFKNDLLEILEDNEVSE